MPTLRREVRLATITLLSVLGSLIITGHAMKYTWKNENNTTIHYIRNIDGRIMGTIWQYVGNSFTWTSKIYAEEFPFTNNSEKYLGHYASQDTAKIAVENYWFQQELTLENKR